MTKTERAKEIRKQQERNSAEFDRDVAHWCTKCKLNINQCRWIPGERGCPGFENKDTTNE